jgi:hypothetical protein
MSSLEGENKPIYIPKEVQEVLGIPEDYGELMEFLDLAMWPH